MAEALDRTSEGSTISVDDRSTDAMPPSVAFSKKSLADPRWDEIIETLGSLFAYEDDWDGMGGVAPEPALIRSSIALAITLRNAGHPAPDGVSSTCDGTVTFDTGPFPVECLEVMTPTHAELWRGGKLLGEYKINQD